MKAACSDEEFVGLFKQLGPTGTANHLNVNIRAVHQRRRHIEAILGIVLESPFGAGGTSVNTSNFTNQINLTIENGTVLVGSDAHIWPGEPTTAMRAFIHQCKELKPKAVVLNGDVLDFSGISKHQKIGWFKTPSVADEIEAAQDLLYEIEKSCGRGAKKIWTIGNHDIRFESRLANSDPEFAKVFGVHLSDHFPNWENCWNVNINEDVVIKHRFKSGIHSTHNSTLWAGCTIITGHLHSAKITPLSDYNGTRYGVDTGCLADTNAEAFTHYTENNPKNWRSGFCVLTLVKGKLLPPELVIVWDEKSVVFRGKVIKV